MSAVVAKPTPVSMTMVTPLSRGRPLRGTHAWSITPAQASSPIVVDALNEVPKRTLHHAKISAPRHDGDIAMPLRVELQQTAFEQSDLIALAGDCARTHFNARRFIAVVMAMELQAALAADQNPILALRRTLVEKIEWGAEIVQASGAAGNKKSLGLRPLAQVTQFNALQFEADRWQVCVA